MVSSSPFLLPQDGGSEAVYQHWRAHKLANYPSQAQALFVEIHDPAALSANERAALLERCQAANMALYRITGARHADKNAIAALGRQLGLHRLDSNPYADEDSITSLQVSHDNGARASYIPYTDRPIHWHTDGYYNPPQRNILGMVLHCARNAPVGGGNALLDHDIAYIQLRDQNPEFIAALQHPHAMTIPPNENTAEPAQGALRTEQTGPVFSTTAQGALHMRYTKRKRNIHWLPAVHHAVQALEALLDDVTNPYVFRYKLQTDEGVVCNNVLHDREGFEDAPAAPRLLFRARYYDRIG